MKKYYKVWFSNGRERTAGLVLDTDRYPIRGINGATAGTSLETISRLFPMFEAPKMKRFIMTSLYDSFEEAFLERSKAQDMLLGEKTL